MERIIMQRGYGKTTQLIKKSANDGSVIVCYSDGVANSLMWEAKNLGIEIPRPISFNSFIEAKYYGQIRPNGLLIDDADLLLQSISILPIKAITLSPYDHITLSNK